MNMRYNIAKYVNGSWHYMLKNFIEYETLIKILSRRQNILEELNMNGNDMISSSYEDDRGYHKYLRKYMVWSEDGRVIDAREFPELGKRYVKEDLSLFPGENEKNFFVRTHNLYDGCSNFWINYRDEVVIRYVLRKQKRKNYSRINKYRFKKSHNCFSYRDLNEEEIYDEEGNLTGYEKVYNHHDRDEMDYVQIKTCAHSWKNSSKMKHQWEKHLDKHMDTANIEDFRYKENVKEDTDEILDGFMNYYQEEEDLELNIV